MQHMRYVCLFRLIYACLGFATVLTWKCSEESLNSHIRTNVQVDLYHLGLCADVILDKSTFLKFYNISMVQYYRLESY